MSEEFWNEEFMTSLRAALRDGIDKMKKAQSADHVRINRIVGMTLAEAKAALTDEENAAIQSADCDSQGRVSKVKVIDPKLAAKQFDKMTELLVALGEEKVK